MLDLKFVSLVRSVRLGWPTISTYCTYTNSGTTYIAIFTPLLSISPTQHADMQMKLSTAGGLVSLAKHYQCTFRDGGRSDKRKEATQPSLGLTKNKLIFYQIYFQKSRRLIMWTKWPPPLLKPLGWWCFYPTSPHIPWAPPPPAGWCVARWWCWAGSGGQPPRPCSVDLV